LLEHDFRAQMEYLKTNDFQGLSVSQALTFPEGSNIAITFDDSCETDLLAAALILYQTGFGATFYITARWLGHRGHLSASQLKEPGGQGFEIGCHSMTHVLLPNLDEAGLKREIADAKSQLEQILGRPLDHSRAQEAGTIIVSPELHARRYRTVATSRIHANSTDTDVFALGRVAILRDLPMNTFRGICSDEVLLRLRT